MSQMTITCPHCAGAFELTEALAAPLIEELEQGFALRIDAKDREVRQREARLSAKELRLNEQETVLEERLAERERELRAELNQRAVRSAREAVALEMEEAARENTELKEQMALLVEKAKDMADERAKLRQLERDLSNRQSELALEVERHVRDQMPSLEAQVAERLQGSLSQELAQKDQKLIQMQKRIDDLQHNARQGSQQIQGAAGEEVIRERLSNAFPTDQIDKVKTGTRGGDLRQEVISPAGIPAGEILWEVKQARSFQSAWLDKLKQDRSRVRAEVAVLVSPVLPDDCRTFMQRDGIWLVVPSLAVELASALRNELTNLARLRTAMTGRDDKATQLYDYLQGPVFRARVAEFVAAAINLRETQDRMRDAIQREMARADVQVRRLRDTCFNLQGDIVDVVGVDIALIEGSGFQRLAAPGETGAHS